MLPYQAVGVGLVDVHTQGKALQAKVVSGLLESERLACRVSPFSEPAVPHT